MESVEVEVIKFCSPIVLIEEKKNRKYISGVGDKAVFEEESLGWFIGLQSSHESFFAGMTRPKARLGTIATVRIEFPCPA